MGRPPAPRDPGDRGLVAVLGAGLAVGLPLRADLSDLLPARERSVRDRERVQSRTLALGLVLCAVASDDPALRAKGTGALAERLSALGPALIAGVVADDGVARRFTGEHRFLFASLDELTAARDTLKVRLGRAKLRANPLYISLDEEEEDRAADKLLERLRDVEREGDRPQAIVSPDGRMQLVIVQAPFPSAAVTQGERLVAALGHILRDLQRQFGPRVTFGIGRKKRQRPNSP